MNPLEAILELQGGITMTLPWDESNAPETGRAVARIVNYCVDDCRVPFGWLAAHYLISNAMWAEMSCTCCESRLVIEFVECEADHEDAMPFLATLDAVEAMVSTWRGGVASA